MKACKGRRGARGGEVEIHASLTSASNGDE